MQLIEQYLLQFFLCDLRFVIFDEKFLYIEGDLNCVLIFHLDQSEDTTHQKAGEHIKVLLQMHLDFDQVILRVVLLLHVDEWATETTSSATSGSLTHY